MDITKKAAEILIKCGYANDTTEEGDLYSRAYMQEGEYIRAKYSVLELFADTLEGRRQDDAIEEYLVCNYVSHKNNLWSDSKIETARNQPQHQWRLDRIKYCLEELSK